MEFMLFIQNVLITLQIKVVEVVLNRAEFLLDIVQFTSSVIISNNNYESI